MPTVTIEGKPYVVYADVVAADEYLGGALAAEAWRDADADTKARALVTGTRWIDAQQWQGEKADPGQVLAWPRTGIEGVDSAQVPSAIVTALFELAARLADDSDYRTSFAATQAKRLKAGSVEIENFRGATVQVTSAFPPDIMALIGQWLAGRAGAEGTAGSRSFGTCRENPLLGGYGFNRGL